MVFAKDLQYQSSTAYQEIFGIMTFHVDFCFLSPSSSVIMLIVTLLKKTNILRILQTFFLDLLCHRYKLLGKNLKQMLWRSVSVKNFLEILSVRLLQKFRACWLSNKELPISLSLGHRLMITLDELVFLYNGLLLELVGSIFLLTRIS